MSEIASAYFREQCDFGQNGIGVNCGSWIGLREVAYRDASGSVHGPRRVCASHRRWLSIHVVSEWLDQDALRAFAEDEANWLREQQDAEDIIDSDGRLLPRGLR